MIQKDPFAMFDDDPDGEDGVRKKLAAGEYGSRDGRKSTAVIWLKTKEAQRKIAEMKRSAVAEGRMAGAAEKPADRDQASIESAREATNWPKWIRFGVLLLALALAIELAMG
ncbi:MAG: hypothetical protein RIC87_20985 [Kiloniellales bacterium]